MRPQRGKVSNGLFIVFEGGEGSGKSTQADRLYERLVEERFRVVLVREPGTTALGLYLRDYLKSKRPLSSKSELLLFAAARAQVVAEQILPNLQNGVCVIADRYVGSTVAYQGYGRRVRREVVHYMNNYVTDGLEPDATFLLDLDPEVGLHRAANLQFQMTLPDNDIDDVLRADQEGHRRFEDLSLSFHKRVRRGYLDLADRSESWHKLDATLTQDQLARDIWEMVETLLASSANEDNSLQTLSLF